jgi:hypothetical protein
MIVTVMCSGLALAAFNTIGLEFGTALFYPANEAAIAGVLECSAELFGFLWVTLGGDVLSMSELVLPRGIGEALFVSALAVAVLSSFVLLVANHLPMKRPPS